MTVHVGAVCGNGFSLLLEVGCYNFVLCMLVPDVKYAAGMTVYVGGAHGNSFSLLLEVGSFDFV